MSGKTNVSEDIGRSIGGDSFLIRNQLSYDEIAWLDHTRAFVDDDVLPVVAGYLEGGDFPWELLTTRTQLAIGNEQELKARIRDEVASTQYPRRIRFVDRLPMKAMGKILKCEVELPDAAAAS